MIGNDGQQITPGMASRAVMDDVTDLSIFEDNGRNIAASSPLNNTMAIDAEFARMATSPATTISNPVTPADTRVAPGGVMPTDQYNPYKRMNVNSATNEPNKVESFKDHFSRLAQIKPNNSPAPVAVSPAVIEAKPNEVASNEPAWKQWFKDTPTAEVAADPNPNVANPIAPTATINNASLDERMTQYFNPDEREIFNNAISVSSSSMDVAKKVHDIAVSQGMDGNKMASRLGSMKPEEIVEMVVYFDSHRAQANAAPAPTAGLAAEPKTIFKANYEPTRNIPGVSLGNVRSAVKEPPMSPLGTPMARWQI